MCIEHLLHTIKIKKRVGPGVESGRERFARGNFFAAQSGSGGGKSSVVIQAYFIGLDSVRHVLLLNHKNQVPLYT